MQRIENRLSKLEKAVPTGEWPMTILIRGMTTGDNDNEIQELHDWKGGQQWERQLGETEQGLIDRASREVTRNGLNCALLIAGERPVR